LSKLDFLRRGDYGWVFENRVELKRAKREIDSVGDCRKEN